MVWRGAQVLNDLEPRLAGAPALIAAMEGWISPPV
jgi:hypothetical protein